MQQTGHSPATTGNPASGYAHPAYAAALLDMGTPRTLPRSGGSLIVRDIGVGGYQDAMGPYPIFTCADWSRLDADLRELADQLVTVALVADPFGAWTMSTLRRCFPDVLLRFKEHFVVRLAPDPLRRVHPHHRRNVARARRELEVETVLDPVSFIDEWDVLYQQLIRRHGIRGVAAFSRRSLAAQLAVPGLVALRARSQGVTVGASLWYEQADVAYYHLAAYDREGYERRASFALFASALELFAERGLAWASLGGGAGATGDPDDGLSRFKRGWSTETRTAWFGGRVLRRGVYDQLSGPSPSRWFPVYRQGEFT